MEDLLYKLKNKNVIVNHLHFKRLVVLVGYILNNNDNKKGIKKNKKKGESIVSKSQLYKLVCYILNIILVTQKK